MPIQPIRGELGAFDVSCCACGIVERFENLRYSLVLIRMRARGWHILAGRLYCSGNPKGRPKGSRNRVNHELAMDKLVQIMKSERSPVAVRMKAAKTILEIAWGSVPVGLMFGKRSQQ